MLNATTGGCKASPFWWDKFQLSSVDEALSRPASACPPSLSRPTCTSETRWRSKIVCCKPQSLVSNRYATGPTAGAVRLRVDILGHAVTYSVKSLPSPMLLCFYHSARARMSLPRGRSRTAQHRACERLPIMMGYLYPMTCYMG